MASAGDKHISLRNNRSSDDQNTRYCQYSDNIWTNLGGHRYIVPLSNTEGCSWVKYIATVLYSSVDVVINFVLYTL